MHLQCLTGDFDVDLIFFLNGSATATHKATLLAQLQQHLLLPGKASAVFQAPNAIKIKGMQTTGSTDTDVDVLLVLNLVEEAVSMGLGRRGDDPRMMQWRAAMEQHWRNRWVGRKQRAMQNLNHKSTAASETHT